MSESGELQAAFAELRREVQALLSGGDRPLAFLAEACAVVRGRDPGARATDDWLRSREESSDLEELTTGVALALFVPGSPWLDRIYGPAGAGALLQGQEAAARWIEGLYRSSPGACRQLLTAWLIRWRVSEGTAAADAALSILAVLPDESTLRSALEVLERAAPDPRDTDSRAAWNRVLLRRARERLGSRFPLSEAARLALREGLLSILSERELLELAPVLAESMPKEMSEVLKSVQPPGALVTVLLRVCRQGLLEPDLGGAGWDLPAHPERWELASRVAEHAASLLVDRFEDADELSWLLWGASRLLGMELDGPTGLARRRFVEALLAAMEADAPDGANVLLRTFFRFWKQGALGSELPRASILWPRLRRRALAEARGSSGESALLLGTLLRITHLDRALLTEPWPEGVSKESRGAVDFQAPGETD